MISPTSMLTSKTQSRKSCTQLPYILESRTPKTPWRPGGNHPEATWVLICKRGRAVRNFPQRERDPVKKLLEQKRDHLQKIPKWERAYVNPAQRQTKRLRQTPRRQERCSPAASQPTPTIHHRLDWPSPLLSQGEAPSNYKFCELLKTDSFKQGAVHHGGDKKNLPTDYTSRGLEVNG